MDKIILRVGVFLGLILTLALPLAGTSLAAAPTITQVDAQVTVLEDARLDVKYRLTFREVEPRNKISDMGPFDPGHQIVEAHLEYDGRSKPVKLVNLGGGHYRAEFPISTSPGKSYTVQVHYKVERSLDVTSAKGQEYRVLEWAPIQWNLSISEEIVRFIPE